MSHMSVEVSQKSRTSVGLHSTKAPNASPTGGKTLLPDVSDGSIGQAPRSPDEAGNRKHQAPTKHSSMLSLSNGNNGPSSMAPMPIKTQSSMSSHSPDVEGTLASPSGGPQRKKSVGRSISSMFKGLFKSPSQKQSDAGSSDLGNTKSSPNMAHLMQANGSASSKPSFSLKAVFNSFSAGPDNAHLPGAGKGETKVQSSAKSSTAAIESEVQAAMRRAASITGRQHAPSTLLAVAKDLPPKMARPVWNLRDYAVVEKMYTGYASNVYKAFCKYSGETVCLKSYTLGNLCDLNRFQIFREVKLHSSLSHEHIIRLFGAFQQADQVVLVQEFADAGDLFTLLHRYGGRLPERTAVELVLHPFLLVINYLHANGIAHRDIKPENILFTADMRLKLCDFGLAINMREERAVTRAGTLEYMAPEVLNCPFKNKPEENKDNERLHYSYHVDTWAVGVLTYELLVGLPPFNDKQRNAVEDKIRGEVPRFPSKISELARDFILRALEKDPIERPTIMDMLNHRWIKIHRRSSSVRQLRPQGEGGAGKEDGAGALGALSPAGGAGAKKKPPNSQFEDIAEEDHLASSDNLAKSSKPPSLLHAAVGGSANPAQHLVGPPSSTSVSSHATNTTKDGMRSVALSAKSFTAGALPKGAFDGLVTPAEVAAAKAVASGSKATSRTATKDFEAV
eukprot:CAMPEP_0202857414 /NCGR_PEP_ID=MMETSP1391-20130828/360_1 /ASSEMBLY_ACC=CAM_ASM_000867 /TAXON_ID=1034604 /ORGANISM="Chlamydomonas leiostraca, Strain SAG 11-49" /LENGTH=678 /DNA_ID=CAMNT_0049536207 /DNA_START=165 /DNA_END=2201 /DNA_ORIENTATION=-